MNLAFCYTPYACTRVGFLKQQLECDGPALQGRCIPGPIMLRTFTLGFYPMNKTHPKESVTDVPRPNIGCHCCCSTSPNRLQLQDSTNGYYHLIVSSQFYVVFPAISDLNEWIKNILLPVSIHSPSSTEHSIYLDASFL